VSVTSLPCACGNQRLQQGRFARSDRAARDAEPINFPGRSMMTQWALL